MDANQIICPKCGSPNNHISEGCVKCGIIFSKYLKLQEKRKENELGSPDKTVGESKAEENPATISAEKPEPVAPESSSADNKVQTIAETAVSEPEVQPANEKKPQNQAQAVEETSMDELKLHQEASAEPLEKQMPINSETPKAGEEEQEIAISHDEKSETVATAEVSPAASETQAADPLTVQEKGGQVSQESSGEMIPEPVAAQASPAIEEVLELVEPVEVDQAAKPETAVEPEKVQSQMKPQPATAQDTEMAKDTIKATPREENIKAAPSEIEQPAKAEQEKVLEEAAEPVQAEAPPMKSEVQAREALIDKQKAALGAAEAQMKEKETQAKAVALKKQKLAEAKAQAKALAKRETLKKQKAAQAKALKKHKIELAKQEALKKQKASQAKAEALRQQKEARTAVENSTQESQALVKESSQNRQTVVSKEIDSKLKILALLKKYEGKTIGINYDNSAEIKEAQLVEANNEFFSVSVKDKKLQFSYPLQTLLSLIEGEDGVEAGEAESKTKFSAVIKVYPLVLF